ncbi:MAG: hypothetical protein RLT05_32295 [Bauldia litoralis]
MVIDVKALSKEQLRNLVDNHRKKNATNLTIYSDALAELERREGKGLDFDKSYEVILKAARERRFISYKDLADASGADWQAVHYSVGKHLGSLVEYAHRRGWPMLSAIVVNRPNVATGRMEPDALRGFVGIARELDIPVVNEEEFLKDQQRAVFDWAASLPLGSDGRNKE